jgi:hypothetical protein
MKKSIFIILLFGNIYSASAQYLGETTFKKKPKLDWNDFNKYVEIYSDVQKAHLGVTIITETKNVNVWTGIITVDSYAGLKPDSSWVILKYGDANLLRYMQLQYDYANMIADKAEREINSKKINAGNTYKITGILDAYLDELRETLKHIDAETDYGSSLLQIEKWESILNEQLSESK